MRRSTGELTWRTRRVCQPSWWNRRDSNPQPSPCRGVALPVELRTRTERAGACALRQKGGMDAPDLPGGQDGTRTHDLLVANEALSPLSYRPGRRTHRRPRGGPRGSNPHQLRSQRRTLPIKLGPPWIDLHLSSFIISKEGDYPHADTHMQVLVPRPGGRDARAPSTAGSIPTHTGWLGGRDSNPRLAGCKPGALAAELPPSGSDRRRHDDVVGPGGVAPPTISS